MSATESSEAIVFYFMLVCASAGAVSMLWAFKPLDWAQVGLLIACGLLGGIGQLCMTYCYRYAEPSLLASFDYAAMVWAVALGYLGGQTKRIKLSSSVSIVPLQNPIVQAKAWSTLDWLTAESARFGAALIVDGDEVVVTGHVGGARRGKKGHHLGQFFRSACTALQRNRGIELLIGDAHCRGNRVAHFIATGSDNWARRHYVDANADRREFFG